MGRGQGIQQRSNHARQDVSYDRCSDINALTAAFRSGNFRDPFICHDTGATFDNAGFWPVEEVSATEKSKENILVISEMSLTLKERAAPKNLAVNAADLCAWVVAATPGIKTYKSKGSGSHHIISSAEELKSLAQVWRLRADWHEPDEVDVYAEWRGEEGQYSKNNLSLCLFRIQDLRLKNIIDSEGWWVPSARAKVGKEAEVVEIPVAQLMRWAIWPGLVKDKLREMLVPESKVPLSQSLFAPRR